jgi:hypothetical protein
VLYGSGGLGFIKRRFHDQENPVRLSHEPNFVVVVNPSDPAESSPANALFIGLPPDVLQAGPKDSPRAGAVSGPLANAPPRSTGRGNICSISASVGLAGAAGYCAGGAIVGVGVLANLFQVPGLEEKGTTGALIAGGCVLIGIGTTMFAGALALHRLEQAADTATIPLPGRADSLPYFEAVVEMADHEAGVAVASGEENPSPAPSVEAVGLMPAHG